jgi:hypothetical protein
MSDPLPPLAAPPPRKGLAVASLVLGLLAIPTLGLLLVGAILSVVLGIAALVKASRHPREYGGQGLAIAGIVAGVVSVVVMPVVIGIGAAIAIPTMLRKRVASNETQTIAQVRNVVAAEHAYLQRAGSYGTLECLIEPAPCIEGYSGPPFLAGDSTSLESGHGYRFSLIVLDGDDPPPDQTPGFVYIAVPVGQGQTGVRGFCGDASGRVCFTVDGTMTDLRQDGCPGDEHCVPLR